MKLAYHTLGCKLNFAETSTYRRAFEAAGCETVPWSADDADVYLLNTCAVTGVAEKKSRGVIRAVHRRAPQARIVVTGCYAELRPAEIEALPGVLRVFGSAAKTSLVRDTLALLSASKPLCAGSLEAGKAEAEGTGDVSTHGHGQGEGPDGDKLSRSDDAGNVGRGRSEQSERSSPVPSAAAWRPEATREEMLPAYSQGDRTRSFLKVQDGCDNFCAYCTVPFARGRSRSLPICEVVRQAREIAAAGTREIVLTGVNTGDFGRRNGESFLDLLKALSEVDGIARYRISSIEPNLLTDEIIDWIAAGGTRFLPHFHIPLQSGSDAILRLHGRRYDTALFASRIDRIREKMGPHVFFGIDIIAGLPGETPERFEESYRFLAERIRPAFLHVFPYSPRPGTRAASMPGQVQDRIKTERVAALEALCERLHDEFVASCRGLEETVLWESACKDGRMEGYTGNYIRQERPYDPALAGTLQKIIIA